MISKLKLEFCCDPIDSQAFLVIRSTLFIRLQAASAHFMT